MRKKTVSYFFPVAITVSGIFLALVVLQLTGLVGGDSDPDQIAPLVRPEVTDREGEINTEIDDPKTAHSPITNRQDGSVPEIPRARPFKGIRACVRDVKTGEPMPSFTAWAIPEGLSEAEQRARTHAGKPFMNTGGMLTLRGLDKGRYTLLVKSQGYLDLTVPNVEVPQKKELLELSMSKGIHITGRVVDTAGNPVKGMLVHINCEPFIPGDLPPSRTSAVTNRDGRFLFGSLVTGKYEIFLQSRQAPIESATGIYLTKGGSFEREFVIPTFNTFRFRVTTVMDQPLVNVSIKVRTDTRTYRAKTDQKGLAQIERIPPGAYELEISKSRFETQIEKGNVTSISGERSFDFSLEMKK